MFYTEVSEEVCRVSPQIDFASLVKRLRAARALTQEQLARELEVTFATVNGWENGRHHPIPALASQLVSMAKSAGISVSPRRRAREGGRRN